MKPTAHQRGQAELNQPDGEIALEAPVAPRPRAACPPVQTAQVSTAQPPGTPPTETAYAAAAQRIKAQLDPREATALQTIDQVVRQVGLTIASWAVGLAQQAQQRQRGEHGLTILEQWVVTCRQIERQLTGAAQNP